MNSFQEAVTGSSTEEAKLLSDRGGKVYEGGKVGLSTNLLNRLSVDIEDYVPFSVQT